MLRVRKNGTFGAFVAVVMNSGWMDGVVCIGIRLRVVFGFSDLLGWTILGVWILRDKLDLLVFSDICNRTQCRRYACYPSELRRQNGL